MNTTDTEQRTASIGQQLSTPRAYKRSPALTNSTWYKGMLHSQMAGTADNGGSTPLASKRLMTRYLGVSIFQTNNKSNNKSLAFPSLPPLHELEQATGVNKSGLYAEFEDKEDLFVQSLRYYLENLEKKG